MQGMLKIKENIAKQKEQERIIKMEQERKVKMEQERMVKMEQEI